MNYTFLYQKLSQKIENTRRGKGMTQEGLAEKAGLHRAYFWDIEQGRNISIKTAYKIAKALGIDLKDLFDF
ncbi:MAG: helix-turn-helix domain-containing protein [Candidatus Omnitrophica bacterium]|nr:helix-turn-helix domain-containing protein [Candidatus Omnitrophota bacterium]